MIRFFAWFIDLLVKMVLIGFIVYSFLFLFGEQSEEMFSQSGEPFFTNLKVPKIIMAILILIASALAFSVTFLYNIILEGRYSTTIGKRVFNLIVVHHSGCMINWKQAIIRNLSKYVTLDFFPSILPIDVIIGIIIERIEPEKSKNQRILDIIAETIVIKAPQIKK